jgi:hypothetical protein
MELFDALFDDEHLLRGPHAIPLAQLVADHQELQSAYRSQLAALVVPDTQLIAVSRQLGDGVNLPVSVMTTGGAGALVALAGRQIPGVDVVSVEPTLRDLDDLVGGAARIASAAAELASDIEIFAGLPHAPGWEAAAELIEAAGLHGKIDAVTPAQTIEQLSILIEMDLPFKITGRIEHEWLAMLVAIDALIDGAGQQDAALVMQHRNHDQFVATVASWDLATHSRIRRRLRRVGTDRVRQLIDDLQFAPTSPSHRETTGTS